MGGSSAGRKGREDSRCPGARSRLGSGSQAAHSVSCSGDGAAGVCPGCLGDPACRWAPPRAALCSLRGRCGSDALPSRPLSSGMRAGQVRGAGGRCTAPWCARVCARCARWGRGAEKLPPSGCAPSGRWVRTSTRFGELSRNGFGGLRPPPLACSLAGVFCSTLSAQSTPSNHQDSPRSGPAGP